MISRSGFRAMALMAVCLLACSCTNSTGPSVSKKTEVRRVQIKPTELVFHQRLFDGDLEMLIAFSDINGDGKPDMILGSDGHDFSDVAPRIQKSEASEETRHYVSHLLNLSDGDEIKFGEPYWPNRHGFDGQLTRG